MKAPLSPVARLVLKLGEPVVSGGGSRVRADATGVSGGSRVDPCVGRQLAAPSMALDSASLALFRIQLLTSIDLLVDGGSTSLRLLSDIR